MAATPTQTAWAADKFGYEVNALEVVIIHDSGAEELVTILTPDTKRPLKPAAETATV